MNVSQKEIKLHKTTIISLMSFQIDNSKYLVTKIATLYAERLMNDICLEVDGVEYPAHRIILCTSSEVFQVLY